MRRIFLALLPALWLSGACAEDRVNPEFGSSPYDALTVFSPDVRDPARYARDVLVVFHGFMSAVPNGTYKRVRKRFKSRMTVIGVNYDPLEVDDTRRFLDEVAKTYLRGRRVTVLGTSLGGFWARYFSNRISAYRLIMLNPIINPRAQLGIWIGINRFNRRRQERYTIEPEAFDAYSPTVRRYRHRPRTLLILTADDRYINPYQTREFFADAPRLEIAWYETGGHTINLKKHPALDRIEQFLSSN